MNKTILITGSTDGIGLETAKRLLGQGHHVLVHGRSAEKLENVMGELRELGHVDGFVADLSDLHAVKSLAKDISSKHPKLDVLINNAGVLRTPNPNTPSGIDVRFVVNTIAPYLLTQALLPLLGSHGRVLNLSSAAQSTVNMDALCGNGPQMEPMDAYAQSKLAITMWSFYLAKHLGEQGATVIAVNPGSLLASKMVKEGFGVEGKDLSIGANILVRLSTEASFANDSGKYYDNDSDQFQNPHSDALNDEKCKQIVATIETILEGS